MDRNSNLYTFVFAIIMVVVVAAALAFTATTLKPLQAENVRQEKMQNILSTIGINISRKEASEQFSQYVKQELALNSDGTVNEDVDAFKIELMKETKKSKEEQAFPLYIAEKEGKTFYVIPLFGAGLWKEIWGYVALDSDKNTIIGASFDHAGETAGLGAEINQSWYEDQYIGKTILDDNNNFVSVKAVKAGATADPKHSVDAISGGTITSDGVSLMLEERLENYLPYFKNN
ncbi:NADH:ubiquinone reductase (Na(+)-transporting) subunit C [Lutimonas sp.]|jgi:Na+-transporting NADH:ubiquinone oxidoreductase subunit C|uniref:NADH:ubiquinone reductase (Na(+)-transporting) subunit C n=1 Tax=Lutimonas sp. TaxID=1872403 RepID=UPI003C712FEA